MAMGQFFVDCHGTAPLMIFSNNHPWYLGVLNFDPEYQNIYIANED